MIRRIVATVAGLMLAGVSWGQTPDFTEEAAPRFGVTVVAPFGFCGRVYELAPQLVPEVFGFAPAPEMRPPGTIGAPINAPGQPGTICTVTLPNFAVLKPVGNIYTTRLNIPPRDFRAGFPETTGRFEWFAIDYTARFWIETPGKYSFRLLSDDGSELYIDERRVITNDCMHLPLSVTGSVRLEGGLHEMRVGYFQGPRFHVALVLEVKMPGGQWRVFDTQEFKPPSDPADWKFPNAANLDLPLDPCKAETHPKRLILRP